MVNITKSPNIVNQKVDTEWCVARRDYEDGRNTKCNCTKICKSIASGYANGKKYYMPSSLDEFIKQLLLEGSDDDDGADDDADGDADGDVDDFLPRSRVSDESIFLRRISFFQC